MFPEPDESVAVRASAPAPRPSLRPGTPPPQAPVPRRNRGGASWHLCYTATLCRVPIAEDAPLNVSLRLSVARSRTCRLRQFRNSALEATPRIPRIERPPRGRSGHGGDKQARHQTYSLHKPPGKGEEQQSESKCGDQEPTLHIRKTLERAEIFPRPRAACQRT